MPITGDVWGKESVNTTAPQMADEIERMKDGAKRAQLAATQNNQAVAMEGAPGPMKQAHDLVAGGVIHDATSKVDPNDPQAQIEELKKRADKLEQAAELVAKSGTGNVQAQQTYLRAAALVRQHAVQIHAQLMAQLHDAAQQAASQPGVPMTPVVR
jgi:hypothetical protein